MVDLILAMATEAMVEDMGMLSSVLPLSLHLGQLAKLSVTITCASWTLLFAH